MTVVAGEEPTETAGAAFVRAVVDDVVAYATDGYAGFYAGAGQLSEARLKFVVYLADWKSAIEHGRQITDLRWVHDRRGLRASEVVLSARRRGSGPGGGPLWKVLRGVPFVARRRYPTLGNGDREVLDFVLGGAGRYSMLELTKLVNSTWPMYSREPPAELDLPALAVEYRRIRPSLLEVR